MRLQPQSVCAVSSTAPTWRDASIALWILSGVYLVFVALVAYGVGGYVAGLLRERYGAAGTPVTTNPATMVVDEVETRDGLHGLLVWALATLLTVLLLLLAASASTRLAAPSAGAAGQELPWRAKYYRLRSRSPLAR